MLTFLISTLRFKKLCFEFLQDHAKIGDRTLSLWRLFDQHHTALCALYPEMQEYIVALANAEGSSAFSLDAAQAAVSAMTGPIVQDIIDPRIP